MLGSTTPVVYSESASAGTISVDRTGITIGGERKIILCASLFYFRVPEGSWDSRMATIRGAGYNCIDVYFPWNFHETAKDEWDFESGMRDVERFLSLAEKHGLYVMARPGPYICSEWDAGGMPAYLFGEDIAIRQNDPAFLERVEGWYSRILPIIAGHQLGNGGSVVLLQIENELDFFMCDDVPGYIGALADSAKRHGITVPVFACAGQADVDGAWGEVDGVIPSLNLYLNSTLPGMEEGIRTYTSLLADLDVPLMVTEMGRDNLLMRRYIASGAKLLGPYNQVSGFNFGFTTSVNNWGDPVSFQPTYYDFRSLVTPYGELRPFVTNDLVLSRFFAAAADLLAASFPSANPIVQVVTGSGDATGLELHALDAPEDNGQFLSLTNIADSGAEFELRYGDHTASARVPSQSSLFGMAGMDLSPLGVSATVDLATAELVLVRGGDSPLLVFQTRDHGQVAVSAAGSAATVRFGAGEEARAQIETATGTLAIVGIGHDEAARLLGAHGTELEFGPERLLGEPLTGYPVTSENALGERVPVAFSQAVTGHSELFSGAVAMPKGAIKLEQNGIVRGFGLYSATGTAAAPTALIVHNAADVASVYANGTFLGTSFPGGDSVLIGTAPPAEATYEIRAEIWGHSNFDDSRKPAIRIKSTRGIAALTEVTHAQPLRLWETDSKSPGSVPYYKGLGEVLTSDRPTHSSWRTAVSVPAGCDSAVLHFKGMECEGTVYADDREICRIDQFSEFADISSAIAINDEQIAVRVELGKRHYDESAGEPTLYTGVRVSGWKLSGAEEPELARAAQDAVAASGTRGDQTLLNFPLSLEGGLLTWFVAQDMDSALASGADLKLLATGSGCKITVVFNDRVCGRLMLEQENGPRMAGAANLGYLPSCWARTEGNVLALLVEATADASIDGIELIKVEAGV